VWVFVASKPKDPAETLTNMQARKADDRQRGVPATEER
jgi:hypothetical protein